MNRILWDKKKLSIMIIGDNWWPMCSWRPNFLWLQTDHSSGVLWYQYTSCILSRFYIIKEYLQPTEKGGGPQLDVLLVKRFQWLFVCWIGGTSVFLRESNYGMNPALRNCTNFPLSDSNKTYGVVPIENTKLSSPRAILTMQMADTDIRFSFIFIFYAWKLLKSACLL